jgi:hypothetical protein
MKKVFTKLFLSLLALLAGPVAIILIMPFYDWSVTGAAYTALFISGSAVLSVWRKKQVPPRGKEEKRRNYEAAQKQANDLRAFFDAALGVCNAYGTILGDSPAPFGAASVLPASKETIKTAIVTLYTLLESSKVIGWECVWYPKHAEEILSEKFRYALRVGYSCLPQYVSDEEAHILARYYQLFSDNREKVQAVVEGGDQVAKLQLAQSLAEQMEQSFDPALPILQRICEESAQSLTELEHRCEQFRRSMQSQNDT